MGKGVFCKVKSVDQESRFTQACQFVALALGFLAAALAIVYAFFDTDSLSDTIFFIPAIAGLVFLASILLKEAVHLIFLVFWVENKFFEILFFLIFVILPLVAAMIEVAGTFHAREF